ncbi:unnamed protein product, partial [Rotaria sp. Silwood1]
SEQPTETSVGAEGSTTTTLEKTTKAQGSSEIRTTSVTSEALETTIPVTIPVETETSGTGATVQGVSTSEQPTETSVGAEGSTTTIFEETTKAQGSSEI